MIFIMILGTLSFAISLYAAWTLGVYIMEDVKARARAKARYEQDPELGAEITEFYVPEVTYGQVFTVLLLWVMPVVNLGSAALLSCMILTRNLKAVWNNPVIDW